LEVATMTRLYAQAKVVSFRWDEPESGQSAEVWELTSDEWDKAEAAIEWVRAYWEARDGGELGSTIVDARVHATRATGGDADGLEDAMRRYADNVRYSTGEGLYEEDCPVFAAHGVERS
jgi:hypothetical protein